MDEEKSIMLDAIHSFAFTPVGRTEMSLKLPVTSICVCGCDKYNGFAAAAFGEDRLKKLAMFVIVKFQTSRNKCMAIHVR